VKSPEKRAEGQTDQFEEPVVGDAPAEGVSAALPPLILTEDQERRSDRDQLRSLAKLLGDESKLVRDELRRQFHGAGKRGRPLLVKASKSEDARTRGHARTLLLELERAAVRRRLISFATRASIDLEAGLFLLGRLHDPSLDARIYRRTLDAFADEVLRRSKSCGTELERAQVLSDYLSKTVGFCGGEGDYHHPDNVHVHRVIETRSGLPLSLCAVYLFVARRIGLRASILPLPGHVMLRVHGLRNSRIIDPFHGCRVRSQASLMSYLAGHDLGFNPNWFRAASDRTMFLRQVNNLVQTYSERGFPSEIETLLDVLDAAEFDA
jgi:regulator of sirC expression with transglutaminase-like and TPR domain